MKHFRRGQLALAKKRQAAVLEGIELLIVTNCSTIAQLREKFEAGVFDNEDWASPTLTPMFPADYPARLRRRGIREIVRDYRRRIERLLQAPAK